MENLIMKYIPFRKPICHILKKMLSAVEKTHPKYSPTQRDPCGRPYCMVTMVGNETGLIKTQGRVHLLSDVK